MVLGLASLNNGTALARRGRPGAASLALSGFVRSRETGMSARLAQRARAPPRCVGVFQSMFA